MKVAFRVDASLQMGSGHVMRCLTLADALRQRGAESLFLCREHPGNLNGLVRDRGYPLVPLPLLPPAGSEPGGQPAHAGWLGATQAQDAAACRASLQALQPDWLVVDHYGLDGRWEQALRSTCRLLMVIDDLADRDHACDLLLDQNLGRCAADYAGRVPPSCSLLVGPQFALLRPEFAALRAVSLQRRQSPRLRQLLVSMGGVDLPDASGAVLRALRQCRLPADARITVVMGAAAPWLEPVRRLAEQMPWPTRVLVNVADMAQHMAECDLAIGAAGSTCWERCCLGVPTLMVVLADNQKEAAAALEAAGAASLLSLDDRLQTSLARCVEEFACAPQRLAAMSHAAAEITLGDGCEELVERLLDQREKCQ